MGQFDWLPSAFETSVFTVFDTETTGLEPKLCKVVEAGGIRFDKKGVQSRFNTLVNPGTPMPPEVSKVNGITDEMLKGQPSGKDVFPDFLRFIGNTILIAHNAQFDVNFINEELARIGLPALQNRVIDTIHLAKDVFPGLPKYSLQVLASRFGIQAKDAHRAEDDARVCMELFLLCLRTLQDRMPKTEALETAAPSTTPVVNQGTQQTKEESEGLFDDSDYGEGDLFSEEEEA